MTSAWRGLLATLRAVPERRWTWMIAALGLASLIGDIGVVLWETIGSSGAASIAGRYEATFHTPAGDIPGTVQIPGTIQAPEGYPDARVTIHIPVTLTAADAPRGLLLSRPIDQLEARWDGVALQNSNVSARPGVANTAASLLAKIPPELATPGLHHLDVELKSIFSLSGFYGEALLGRFAEVRETLARRELHLVALTASLHAAAMLWMAIALIRPNRAEFLWGGLLWGSLGVHYFTSSESWSLLATDVQTRVLVRESAGVTACIFATLYTSRLTPKVLPERNFLLFLSSIIYFSVLTLPLHNAWPLLDPVLVGLGVVTILACSRSYYVGARAGNPVARSLLLVHLVPMMFFFALLSTDRMVIDWLLLPSLIFFVLSCTVIVVAHHASLSDRYEQWFASARDAVLLAKRDGSVQEANREAKTLFQIGRRIPERLQSDDVQHLKQHLAPGPEGRRADLVFTGADGNARIIESVAVDVDDDRVLLVARDVTGRANAERSLVHVSRMETVGVVAGGLVHDLNNALTGLLAHVDTLKEGSSPETSARLERIAENILRAARTGRHVATLIRDGVVPPKTQDFGAVVRETAHWIAQAHPQKIPVNVHIDDALPPIQARTTEIEQLVVNLVGNALRVSPPDGTVRVAATCRAGQIELTVEDDGGGVPEPLQARIWEPFFTTRPDGSGIGLAVVARIARDLGGEAVLENGKRGARFRVNFPAERPTDTPTKPARPAVTLVASDTMRRTRLRAMLLERGFEVDTTEVPKPASAAVVVWDAPDPSALEQATRWWSSAHHARSLLVRPADAQGEAPDFRRRLYEPVDAEALAAGVRWAMFSASP